MQTQNSGRTLRKNWEIKHCCPFDHDDGMGLVGCDGIGCVVWQHRLCCYPNTEKAVIHAIKHYCEACKAQRTQESQNADIEEQQAFELPIRSKGTTNSRIKAKTDGHASQVRQVRAELIEDL